MIKKLFTIICLFFLATGCSVNYDLYVGQKLTDNIFLYEENDILNKIEHYDMNVGTELNIDNYSYQVNLFERNFNYIRKEYGSSNFSGYIYNYTYNYDKMNEKSMIYNCYDQIKINGNESIIIETSDEFKCFDYYNLLDDVTINIHCGGELLSTNSDSYNNEVYTWYINKDNYKNKPIYLEIKKQEDSHILDVVGGIIFLILLIISLTGILWYKRKIN